MKLYIANLTRQERDFVYKIPEGQQRMQQIPVGRQIILAGDLSQGDIDAVVKHHARYGMKSVDEVIKAKTFTGLCYSIDKPVKLENMQIGIERNDAVLQERGQQTRKEAAVAISENLSKQQGAGDLKSLQTEVVEEKRDGSEGVNETVVVSKDAPEEEQVLTGQKASTAKAQNSKRK